MAQPDLQTPKFPINETAFISTLKGLLAARGKTKRAELLSGGKASIEYRGEDFGIAFWGITVRLPIAVYAQIANRDEVEMSIQAGMKELLRCQPQDDAGSAVIAPIIGAKLRTVPSGVTNQGNVYPFNPPRISHDGLHFRSHAEARLYRALKQLDVTVAPLPAFVRGPRRVEPDFLIIKDAFVMVVEVDGPSTHTEAPVDAERRLSLFRDEGVHVERVYASDCDTDEAAGRCAKLLVAKFERYSKQR